MSGWYFWLPEFWSRPFISEEPELPLFDTASSAALASSDQSELEATSEVVSRPAPKAKAFPRPPSPSVEGQWDINIRPRRPGPLAVVEFGLDFQSDILKATNPDALAELLPIFLDGLTRDPSLRSLHSLWTPAARLGRALRAGISAARVLAGRFHKQARSPSIPFDNELYLCLACREYPHGFWTLHYLIFLEFVGDRESGGLQTGSVSHAFPTFAEGEAFLRGAGQQWPQALQDL